MTDEPGPDDELSRRRMAKAAADVRMSETLADLGPASRDVEQFDGAILALEQGREASTTGDLPLAERLLSVAAEAGVGDAALLLAGVLVKLDQYRDALRWCAQAEQDGFDEAADLAVKCRVVLGEATPVRPGATLPAEPVIEVDPSLLDEQAPEAANNWLPSVDPGLTRRLKALACTAPLHDLDAHKGSFTKIDASGYQLAEIGMYTIDQVAIAMDFDAGAVPEQVVERVCPFVAAQAPNRPREEHEELAKFVLNRLINVGSVDRRFTHVYGEIDAAGVYRTKRFPFRLIEEVAGPGGAVYLRATDEAINVLVGALDTDVESAQIAAEVKLQNLIDRGLLTDARIVAEQARYNTVQYGEKLRRRLEATRRDVRLVDWDEELPKLLDDALEHIGNRYNAEHAILHRIADIRDMADDPTRKRQAAELVAIVKDCVRRHTQLQARLQKARAVFRAEQDRQQFSGPARRSTFNLHGQLLTPLLTATVNEAKAPLVTFFQAASGVTVPEVVSLPSVVDRLFKPGVERSTTAGPVVNPTLDGAEDTTRFTSAHWDLADELLDLRGRARPLTAILAEAAELDPDLPVLVALRAFMAVSPAVGTAIARKQDSILVGVPTGEPMPSGADHGISGDELLLGAAEITPPPIEETT